MIDLGRNFSWDRAVDKTLWKDLQTHDIITKHKFQALDLSMMALSIGFKHKCPKPFKKTAIGSGGDIEGLKEEKVRAKAFILSVAVYHTGSLDILEKKGAVIRRIAEEYANGGLPILHKIFMSAKSDKAIIADLVKIMKDVKF